MGDVLPDASSLVIGNLPYQKRPHEPSLVGNGRHGRQELQRRDGNFLPYGQRREGALTPLIRTSQDSDGFPGKIDSRFFTKAERAQELIDLFAPQLPRHFDEGHVAGSLNGFTKRHPSGFFMVMNHGATDRNLSITRIQHGVGGHAIQFQGGGGQHHFERRARFVGIGHTPIPPTLG